MKLDTKSILVIAVVAVLVIQFAGIYDFTQFIPTGTDNPINPNPTNPPAQITDNSVTANAKWAISDQLNKVATANSDTAYVCIVRADDNGYFDLLSPVEETEFDASPDTSSSAYSTGDELLIAVTSDNDPTTGDETYPRWYYIQSLDNQVAIKALPLNNPISALQAYSAGGLYKYKVNSAMCETTTQKVSLLDGTTPYWQLGDHLDVIGRADNAGVVFSISNKGTTGVSVSDGSTWDDTSTEVNANFTLTSDSEIFYFNIVSTSANVAWGLPTLAVTSNGEVEQYNGILVFGVSATAMSPATIMADGWEPFTLTGCTNNATYYYVLDAVNDGGVPSFGDVVNIQIPLTISDTGLSASTEYNYAGWMLDWQNVDNVARGSFTTALPASNGFLSEHGSDTVNQARAPTLSSGTLSTPQLYGYFTTNA